ncbi:hypothetical protein NIES2101_28970 [Calothrix sp. HK-06]|nr:hypothetical protein NIES2101_28970 [Calothrix sp. HK-06]
MTGFPNDNLAKSLEKEYCNLKSLKTTLQSQGLSSAALSVDDAMSDIWAAIQALGKQPEPPC